MTATTTNPRRFPIQILDGIRPIDRSKIPVDVLAGVTLAALAIPEVMGYSKIAGMPIVTGLYTIVVPVALFAVLGSSRHLVVGADSATAAILAAGLAGMAAAGSDQYVALAGLLALMAAAFLILSRLVGLGFLADFLSATVLIGFLTGVGVQVAMGQVAGMLGVSDGSGTTLQKFWHTIENIPDTSGTTLLVSLAVLAVILFGKYVTTAVPGALIAVIGSIIVSWAIDLEADGVAVLGPVPGGLPSVSIPDVAWSDIRPLLTVAFSMFILILAQSAATSRAYAAKYGERFSEDVDLVGLGAANIGAALTGTYVVNGSPTKTQMVDSAGGRSQIASLTTAAIVVIVLLFLTKPLQYMPEAVLSAVVFLIGVELIKALQMKRIYQVRPDEFVVALITAAVVVVVGVEQGILLAMALSIVAHVRRSYRPNDTVLVTNDAGELVSEPVARAGQVAPGLIIYRFGASLYYANAYRLAEEVRGLVESEGSGVRWFCIDASAISDIDYSASETLREIYKELKGGGIRLVIANLAAQTRAELDGLGITELVGPEAYFDSIEGVLEAYKSIKNSP